MDIFQNIAEERIREAMERGEFDNLQNSGQPLKLDRDAWVPEDLRMAYKVLNNSGCLPPELELRKEILCLRELIDTLDDNKERLDKIRPGGEHRANAAYQINQVFSFYADPGPLILFFMEPVDTGLRLGS
jgi:hypothetical protein